jgi:hypothetical protein
VGLAIAAPVTAFVATESGEAFQQVLTVKQYSAHVLDLVATHAEYARAMFFLTAGLGVATILQLLFAGTLRGGRLPRWVAPALVAVVLALAGTDLVYVYLAGDSGARAAWTGVL